MSNVISLPDSSNTHAFKAGDVFLLFGELFPRGYANGLVDEAKKAGMTIIGVTVGRREKDNSLRPLNEEELKQAEENLGGEIINVPLWAGFDMDPANDGSTASEAIATIKPADWKDTKLDWDKIAESQANSVTRLRGSVAAMAEQLKTKIPQGANLFLAHTMAGGIPKSKIFLVLLNRAVKAKGDRAIPSKELWESELGLLASKNYDAITADTFKELIDGTAEIREMVEGWGGVCTYSAYGYHGTEILIDGEYRWQCYSPYLPGWSKKRLEDHAKKAFDQGIKAVVYNCPEVRTNSSDLFSGVEMPLYTLLRALKKEKGGAWADQQFEVCAGLLKDEYTLEQLLDEVDQYHVAEEIAPFYRDFENWPLHNNPEMVEVMLTASERVMAMNQDKKNLITDHLSGLVVESSGRLMFNEAYAPHGPVLWLNHDLMAKELNRFHQ